MNVLLIISEDNGQHLGCYGDPNVATPNIDRLASEGVRFENAYTTQAVCSPGRASIYTGLYQALKPSFEAAGQLPAHAATGREAAETREKSLRTSVGPPASEPEPVSSEAEASLRTRTYGPKVSSQDVARPSGAVSSI